MLVKGEIVRNVFLKTKIVSLSRIKNRDSDHYYRQIESLYVELFTCDEYHELYH